MSWYYAMGGEQKGPVQDAALKALRDAGDVRGDTLVWKEGMADWRPFAEVAGQLEGGGGTIEAGAAAGESAMATCAYSGRRMPRAEMIRYGDSYVAPEHKEAFVQRLREAGEVRAEGRRFAGFWIRFAAKFIDGIILNVAGVVPQFLITRGMMPAAAEGGFAPEQLAELWAYILVSTAVSGAIQMVYVTVLVGRFEATLGKMALGLKVVNADGSRVTYLKAFARFWAEWVSGLTLMIGYIIAAFDDEKRALHDHICSTRVVWKK